MARRVLTLARVYVLNVLIGIDQLGNTILGGAPDETVSSVLGKARRGDYGRAARLALAPLRWLVDGLFRLFGDRDHCARSIEEDEGRESVWAMTRSE